MWPECGHKCGLWDNFLFKKQNHPTNHFCAHIPATYYVRWCDLLHIENKTVNIFFNFCGLLRKYKLYLLTLMYSSVQRCSVTNGQCMQPGVTARDSIIRTVQRNIQSFHSVQHWPPQLSLRSSTAAVSCYTMDKISSNRLKKKKSCKIFLDFIQINS